MGSKTWPDCRWHDTMHGEHCSHVREEPVSTTMAYVVAGVPRARLVM